MRATAISFAQHRHPGSGAGARIITGVLLLAALVIAAQIVSDSASHTDFSARLAPPDAAHWFGTDVLGRDLFARTLQGLLLSLGVGAAAAGLGTLVALGLAALSTLNRSCDVVVGLLVDSVLGLPHFVLLLLIAFALGGGTQAVILAVALIHWPSLSRLLRAEIRQTLNADYVRLSRHLGKSRLFILYRHVLPHLLPQCLVGCLLLFPHAILHEAALTFLGFGLTPGQPAIGVLLADAMRYVSAGYWWLGVFPGLGLLLLVLTFGRLADGLRHLTFSRVRS
ncbi:ABC transporter permease [Halomonas sp. Bachu 37]|uniref:ABC transporter permease n=1 Tax=Halomonas kashgarensis TaxID=3084920 RepID=UPI0032163580